MKRKIVLLSIALIMAGFFVATAQNNFMVQERLQRQNARSEYPDFENPKLPTPKKAKSGQNWWMPDTINMFPARYTISPNSRDIFKYNSHGLLAERISQTHQRDNSWENEYLCTYTYDSNNNLQTILRQRWVNNSWVYYRTYTYIYDSNNNVLNDGRSTYTYDSNNNVLTKEWNNSIETYTYDSNNNMLTSRWQIRIDNSLFNYRLQTYTYDSNNNVSTLLHLLYGTIASLYTYTYNSNNNIQTELWQAWENNSWRSYLLSTYTYDSNNNLITILTQECYNNSNPRMKRQWVYDENDNCISLEIWDWRDGNWQQINRNCVNYLYYNNMQSVFEWEECYKMTASYKKVSSGDTGIEDIKTELPVQIYSAGKIIHVNNPAGINAVVTVYGIDGVKVAEQTIVSQTTTIEMPVSGLYLVSVKAGNEKPVAAKLIVR